MHKFFGIICLIFISGIASSIDEDKSTKSYCITPIKYFIELTLNIKNNLFIVNSAALINVSCTLPTIKLTVRRYCDKPTYTISYIYDNLNYVHCATEVSLLMEVRFSLDIRSKIIDVLEREGSNGTANEQKKDILPGIYLINANYSCTLNRVATVLTYTDEFEAKKFLILPRIPANWIFLYGKSPAIEARFIIRINHKDTETAISNMPFLLRTVSKRDTCYTVFHTTPVMPFSMIAPVVVPNEIVPNENTVSSITKGIIRSRLQVVNATSYTRSLIFYITLNVKNKWEDIPQLHVHYVALPSNFSHYESTVTTGLVLFREADIVYDEEIDSIIKRREVTCLVARNVIQEIFSKWIVTFKKSDLWFIEGFSTYYGAYIVSQISDESLLKSIVVQTRREFLDYVETIFKYNSSELITQSSTFSKLWQVKIFSLFHMLNVLFLTPDSIQEVIMQEAINIYYLTSYDNYNILSTPDDIWIRLEFNENFKKNTRFSDLLNMKNVITSWTTQVGYPVVQVQRNIDKQLLAVKVIDCFGDIQGEPCTRKWWIPMTYVKIQKDTNTVLETMYLLPQRDSMFISSITKEDFIIIVKQTGYRVNYDRQTWKNIAAFLKTVEPNFLSIHDITFAQILDDAFYFLVQNPIYNDYMVRTDLDIFFDLASNLLRRKSSYIEWYPMLTALEYMSKVFPFVESANIKDKILQILNRFLEDTTHKRSSENSDSNHLYHEVIKWTCILDGLKCKEHVTAIVKWHLNNRTTNKLLSSWQKWIYCQGLKFENITYKESDLWRTIVIIHQLKEIVELLPCSTNNSNIFESLFAFQLYGRVPHLEYIGNEINSASKVTNLFDMFAKHSKNVASLNIIILLLEHGILSAFDGDVSLLAVANFIINHIYSDKGLDKITGEWLYSKLQDLFNKNVANFMLDIIIKKVEYRKNFLFQMRKNIPYKPHYVFMYKNMNT